MNILGNARSALPNGLLMWTTTRRACGFIPSDRGGEVLLGPGQGTALECAGFTLLQMLVTIAVIGVLSAFAIPTLRNAMRSYRLSAAVSAATGAISATRYQAIMRAYPYQLTFSSSSATYQVANEPTGASSFSNVGGAVPISGVGDVTISPTTTLQFNANGTVTATTGTLSFTITNTIGQSKTITVSGVGNVTVN